VARCRNKSAPNVKWQDAACGGSGKHRQEAPSIRERDPAADGLGSDGSIVAAAASIVNCCGGRRGRADDLWLVVGGAIALPAAARFGAGRERDSDALPPVPSPFPRLRRCSSSSSLLYLKNKKINTTYIYNNK
jgi:hypothetical protein